MRKPIDTERISQVKKDLDSLKRKANGRPFMLFTMFNMTLNYLKLLYYLKKQGVIIILMVADDSLHGALPLEGLGQGVFFDYMYASNPYDLEVPLIISEYELDLIHAVAGSGPPFPICEMIRHKCSPVIVEYCDIREIMFNTPEDYHKYMGVRDWHKEQDAWGHIFTYSDGIVFKDSPETMEVLKKRHGTEPTCLQFMSYPAGDFMPNQQVKRHPSATKAHLSVVYAGSVHNNPLSHAYPVHRTLLEIIKKLVSQNMGCTVINAMDTNGSGYKPYLALSAENRLFRYCYAVPQDQLAESLSGSDYGLFYFDYDKALEAEFFHKTTFGSKIFNYLEAGLPVLVSSATGYMAEVVRGHGIGMVVSRYHEIDHLHETLTRQDKDTLLKNIKTFLEKFSMEVQMPRLLNFYNTICKKPMFDVNYEHLISIRPVL